MSFNANKWTGATNAPCKYEFFWKELQSITEERDLGVVMTIQCNWIKQIEKKLERFPGFFTLSTHRVQWMFVFPYTKSLLSQHLEYCVHARVGTYSKNGKLNGHVL